MKSEEQWSQQDFIQINPRWREGPDENIWEEQPFSFLCPASGEAHEDGSGEGHHCRDEDGNEKREEQELQKEFEFSNIMSTSTSTLVDRDLSSSGISPADDLFFKGQLLPLHLPPRIQMVKQLVLGKQQQEREQHEPPLATTGMRNIHRNEENNVGHVHAAMNALSIGRFARLFQPMYSKFCNIRSTKIVPPTPARLGNSWWDPRDSHAHENSSAGSFTSTDRGSFGESSSSRDSNGSSQDCFDSTSKNHFHTSDSKAFLHNREVYSTHSPHPERPGGISTWLRPAFKWKVLFGAENSSATSSIPSSPYDIDMRPGAHHIDAPSEFLPTSSNSPVATDRYYSDCSGELTHSGDLLLSSRAFIHGGDMEKYPRGRERVRGYFQRYMKALNPYRRKDIQRHSQGHGTDEGTTRASPPITTSKISPPVSQNSKFTPMDVALRMKRPRSPSPQPGPRRVSTVSASSELHSAIQGAIAHCKESENQHEEDDEFFDLKCVDQNIL